MKQIFFLFTYSLIQATNPPNMKYDISQIDFKASSCEGQCPAFTMTILYNGAAEYDAILFNEQVGKFKTIIKKPQLDSLMMLVQNANLFGLKNNYTTLASCLAYYTLTVKLKNGKIKIIEDYGSSGPDELREIYDLIFSLRKTQEWK